MLALELRLPGCVRLLLRELLVLVLLLLLNPLPLLRLLSLHLLLLLLVLALERRIGIARRSGLRGRRKVAWMHCRRGGPGKLGAGGRGPLGRPLCGGWRGEPGNLGAGGRGSLGRPLCGGWRRGGFRRGPGAWRHRRWSDPHGGGAPRGGRLNLPHLRH